jgi:hypothetical protein
MEGLTVCWCGLRASTSGAPGGTEGRAMRRLCRSIALALVTVGVMAAPPAAQDPAFKMDKLFTSGTRRPTRTWRSGATTRSSATTPVAPGSRPAAARVAGGTPTGWEGVRVFTMSDNPANPFQTSTPVDMQYADCGAHTITAWTGFAENATNPRLIAYISSYRWGPARRAVTRSSRTPPTHTTRTRPPARCTA